MAATQDSRILTKRSTITTQVPTVAPSTNHLDGSWGELDIYKGELFLNIADDKAWFRSDNGIIELQTIKRHQSGNTIYAIATGTDTYTATISPAISGYSTGMSFNILFANANTGASTLNLNGLGAVALKKSASVALASGDIVAGAFFQVVYDGTNFQITTIATGAAFVSDAAYSASWNGITTIAPSKNAVYDKIQKLDRILYKVIGVGNVGTGADTLVSYTLPAIPEMKVGDSIDFHCFVRFLDTLNSLSLTLYAPSNDYNSGSLVPGGDMFMILRGRLIVSADVGAGDFVIIPEIEVINTPSSPYPNALKEFTSFVYDSNSGGDVIKIVAEGVDDNDILVRSFEVRYSPAP